MLAIPVAMPRRSGNHLTSVLTGEIYPSPQPIPPITPIPRKTSTDWPAARPMPPTIKPIPKNSAAAVAATRGPRRSTQGPPKAALRPSRTSAVVNVVYGGLNHQGLVGNSAWIGLLNVLHAYTDPMHTCTPTAPRGMRQRFGVIGNSVARALYVNSRSRMTDSLVRGDS